MEEIEKSGKAQLAREIEIALPVELDRAARLALVRAYVRDNFVTAGMCADFALHDKGDGNPHAHIMLTMRPLEQSGEWGAKCRKEYDVDGRGRRIPDGKGGWKNHHTDTTDWNDAAFLPTRATSTDMIAADNKLLKEIKARMTRLYNRTKEQAVKPQGKESVMAQLWQARQETEKPATQYSKITGLDSLP